MSPRPPLFPRPCARSLRVVNEAEEAPCSNPVAPSLLRAAESGDAEAQLAVAHFYCQSFGQRARPELAARWYARAAQQRVPEAMYFLSVCYL